MLELFERRVVANNRKFDDLAEKVVSTELSKQAKKEYYLKNKDKGVEA